MCPFCRNQPDGYFCPACKDVRSIDDDVDPIWFIIAFVCFVIAFLGLMGIINHG